MKLNECRKPVSSFGNIFCIIMSMLFPVKREKGSKLYATLLTLSKLQLILSLQLIGDKVKS